MSPLSDFGGERRELVAARGGGAQPVDLGDRLGERGAQGDLVDDRTSPQGVPVEAPEGHVAIRLVDRELDVLERALAVLIGEVKP